MFYSSLVLYHYNLYIKIIPILFSISIRIYIFLYYVCKLQKEIKSGSKCAVAYNIMMFAF